jgi:NCAIR mutase (PurE)-related protein
MTNAELWQYHTDIQTMNPTVRMLLKGRVAEFYKQNEIRVKTLTEKINKLQHNHFVVENNQIKSEEKEGKQVAVCKEGKTLADFEKAFQELMQQGNLVII